MKKRTSVFITILLTASVSFIAYSWGFWGHKRINRIAVFTLPPEMFAFYKKNVEFVTEHAVDPDKRRYSDPKEAPRHYMDMDHYSKSELDSMPLYWKDAVAKYTEDTLNAYGIVPWYVIKELSMLTSAFKKGDIERILNYSADLGHYVADAHVPLHTTENYNGQKTNQIGIHGFWESRIPELNGDNYDYFLGRASYIENPQKFIWKVVHDSHAAVDSVLGFEAALNSKFPKDRKYVVEQRGKTTVTVYSQEYTEAYDKMLNGMVERRMRASIIAVGSLWYTAWVNAGKPDLSAMQTYALSDEQKKKQAEEDRMWKTGKPPVEIQGHSD